MANLFFENSTRTRCAFELAATQLGWHTLNFSTDKSATQKGESFIDTVLTLGQMPIHSIAIRHHENNAPELAATTLDHSIPIINAGDGTNEHPTQALADMLTILLANKNFKKLSIAIVGDIKHSRVARSNLHALTLLGVEDIRIIAPKSLTPDDIGNFNVTVYDQLNLGLKDADVVMMLRFQKERMDNTLSTKINTFSKDFCLTKQSFAHAKPDAIILHPGPVNQNVEIDSELVYCDNSHILKQVKHGVAVRMAVIDHLNS